MSIDDKIDKILQVTSGNDCSITLIDDGWVINGIPINKSEFPILFNKIFYEQPIEKKHLAALLVLAQMGPLAIDYLPRFTNIIITKWFSEKKFLDAYLTTLTSVVTDISFYIDSIIDYHQLADLGSLLELTKKYDLSIKCWKKVVELKKDFFFGWMRLSFLYLQFPNVNEAILAIWTGVINYGYDIPVSTSQNKLDPQYNLDLEKLINLLQKKDKENFMLFFINGLIHSQFYSDYISAINCFIKCLRLNPTLMEAQYKLATLFGKVGDKKNQIETYERILQTDPTQREALNKLALIYKGIKVNELAVHYFEQLHRLEQNNKDWLRELIGLYRTSSLHSGFSKQPWKRDLNKAYFYFKKLSDLKSGIFESTDDFSSLLNEMQKYEEAKELLLNHLAHFGINQPTMRKLEAIYLWLKLPFDSDTVTKEINFRRDKDSAYPKILNLLSQVRSNIPITLPRIAKFVEFPEDKMEILLKQLVQENPDVGEYLELEQVFIRKENTEGLLNDLKIRYSTCYYCGIPLESLTIEFCSSCKKEILKCSICKLPISFGEEIGKCSLCEAMGHLAHFEEWVKSQGKCPRCLQDLPLEGIQPIIEHLHKKS